jgi:hypothetical protein
MFEWLKAEIAHIKTNRFHEFVTSSKNEEFPNLPHSYTQFIREFGEARLYREGSSYTILVYKYPRPITLTDGDELLQFGYSSKYGHAYYKKADLSQGVEAPIFEYDPDFPDSILEYRAANFEIWLSERCRDARQTFSPKEWEIILKGPVPFSADELSIIAARHQFRWEILRISDDDRFEISIQNNSQRTLPYLSIGVKAIDGSLHGGAWLSTAHILPGEQAIVRKSLYPRLAKPDQLILFALPDPEPEDRSRYWEFKEASV